MPREASPCPELPTAVCSYFCREPASTLFHLDVLSTPALVYTFLSTTAVSEGGVAAFVSPCLRELGLNKISEDGVLSQGLAIGLNRSKQIKAVCRSMLNATKIKLDL